jgi:hypothetical protein
VLWRQVPLLRWLVPRQRRCDEALLVINSTLDSLIAKSKRLVRAQIQSLKMHFSIKFDSIKS